MCIYHAAALLYITGTLFLVAAALNSYQGTRYQVQFRFVCAQVANWSTFDKDLWTVGVLRGAKSSASSCTNYSLIIRVERDISCPQF